MNNQVVLHDVKEQLTKREQEDKQTGWKAESPYPKKYNQLVKSLKH